MLSAPYAFQLEGFDPTEGLDAGLAYMGTSKLQGYDKAVQFGRNNKDKVGEPYALLQDDDGTLFLNSGTASMVFVNGGEGKMTLDDGTLSTNGRITVGNSGPFGTAGIWYKDGGIHNGVARQFAGARKHGSPPHDQEWGVWLNERWRFYVDGLGRATIGTDVNHGSLYMRGTMYFPFHAPDSVGTHAYTVRMNRTNGQILIEKSSSRYKANITPLKDDFTAILKTKPMTYTSPRNPDSWEIGYIAEDFHENGLEKLVIYDKEGRPDSICYDRIILYLTEIVKSQQAQIEKLHTVNTVTQQRFDSLQSENLKLKKELTAVAQRQENLEAMLLALSTGVQGERVVKYDTEGPGK